MTVTCIDCVKIICCVFLPPVAVGLERGWTNSAFFLNIILTILGWLPGQIHACCVVLIDKDKEDLSQVASGSQQPKPVETPAAETKAKEEAPKSSGDDKKSSSEKKEELKEVVVKRDEGTAEQKKEEVVVKKDESAQK